MATPPIQFIVEPGILLTAALIAATVFGLYQWRQRRHSSGVAIGAAIASKEAMEQVEETSRLVNFAHALTRVPELESVAAAAATHVPLLVPNRRAWVMIRAAGVWEPLMTVGDTPPADRERAAAGHGRRRACRCACPPMTSASPW